MCSVIKERVSVIKKGARGRAVAIGSAVAASLLLTLATSAAASADSMRTLNLSISCATGEAYGLQVDTGSGFYQPSGSSTVTGGLKVFTVSIPASAATLRVMPLSCAGQPSAGAGPYPDWAVYSITPGASTVNASSFCQDYAYNYGAGPTVLIFDCNLSSITYS
jgi:hypothetical protein